MRTQLSKFRSHYDAYKRTFYRVLGDAFHLYKKEIFSVFSSGLIGVCGQLAGIGLIFIFARLLENGGSLKLFGLSIEIELSMLLLMSAGLTIFILLFISALFQYFSDRKALAVACDYEEALVRRIVSLASRQPLMIGNVPPKFEKDSIRGLITKDARIINRILNLLLQNQVDIIFFIAFFISALWIDWISTSVILLLVCIYLFLLYQINIRGAIYSIRIDKLAKPSSKEKASLIDRIEKSTIAIDENDRQLEKIFNMGKTGEFINAFEQRLAVTPASRLLSTTFTGLIICGVAVIQGAYILFYGGLLSKMIVYLLCVRQVLVKLSKLGMAVTSINRLYPHARRYFEFQEYFIDNIKKKVNRISNKDIKLNVKPLHDSRNEFIIKRGNPIVIITNRALDRIIAIEILKLIEENCSGQAFLISSNADAEKQYYEKERKPSKTNYIRQLKKIDLLNKYGSYFSNCENGRPLPSELIFHLMLIDEIESDHEMVFINGSDLNKYSDIQWDKIVSQMYNKFIIIVAPKDNLNTFIKNNTKVVIFNGIQVVGWTTMEWISNNPDVLLNMINASETQSFDDVDIVNYFDE